MKISIFPKIVLLGNILSKMVLIKRWIVLFLCIFCLFYQALFSQSYSSKNNYTGARETPASWTPTWIVPQTDLLFNGY
jgi:hypothetical protein